MSELTPNNTSQFIIYQTEGVHTKIEVRLENETVWLTQKLMAELFQVSKSSISEHIKHIYKKGELLREVTVRTFRTVQTEGERKIARELECYTSRNMISSICCEYSIQTGRMAPWKRS